jgi:hypothetical protein
MTVFLLGNGEKPNKPLNVTEMSKDCQENKELGTKSVSFLFITVQNINLQL